MSEVLYRKWRPRSLSELVGQEPVVQTIRQAVNTDRVAHAYLFCGPRGTGKTSTARILAKAVNCQSPVNGEPDNECSFCVAVNEGRALDLIEIDAASNRGIDDIRDLSDKINFTPSEGRYKVYIIDEVHMLTEPAFNALLKTLEEPPGHAIFILATTEAHKVPLTVISRCQRFDFRRIDLESMVDKLKEICDSESVDASPEALALISRASSGGLRDAENLLEQVIVSYGSPIAEDDVRDLLGLGGDEKALELVSHIVSKSVRDGLIAVNEVAAEGTDLRQLHRSTLEFLRAVLLLKTKAGTALGYSDEVTAKLDSMANGADLAHVVRALKIFSEADMRRDGSSPLPLELAIVESCEDMPAPVAAMPPPVQQQAPTYSQAPSSAPRQPAYGPPGGQQARPQPSQNQPPAYAVSGGSPNARPSAPAVASTPSVSDRTDNKLRPVARALRHVGKKYKVGALLNVCKDFELGDIDITLKFSHVSNMERMQEELEDPETRQQVRDVVSKEFGKDVDIKIAMINGDNSGPIKSAAQSSPLVSAAMKMGARVVDEVEAREEPSHDE